MNFLFATKVKRNRFDYYILCSKEFLKKIKSLVLHGIVVVKGNLNFKKSQK